MTVASNSLSQYIFVTTSYWAFTLTDGALRMLVVLYFHQLGYSPMEVATLFLLYEFFGVVTNLVGGWLAAHWGLNTTMHVGLALQIVALTMLAVDPSYLTVVYVMVAQALSGIAKDLNKMSAKSSVKLLLPQASHGKLYRWVALLTGSKNTLKGFGFFLGALLLSLVGFQSALKLMSAVLALVLLLSLFVLQQDLGKTQYKPKFKEIFSKSGPVNYLSAARLFLFGSRDVWFVVALPIFLQSELDWQHMDVGILLATWIIAYGLVQSCAPLITGIRQGKIPAGKAVVNWGLILSVVPLLIVFALHFDIAAGPVLVAGLLLFGFFFAINSSIHSFLIVAYAQADGVSMDVGFYYMANAAGRLLGTVLSGWVYQCFGLEACLLVSATFIITSSMISMRLPEHH